MRSGRFTGRQKAAKHRKNACIQLERLESRILLNGHPDGAIPSLVIDSHPLSAEELDYFKERIGVAAEGHDYNVTIDGHGTGLRLPTDEEWKGMVGDLQIVDSIGLAPSQSPSAPLPSSVDWSQSVYFPPIGNQDGEGSCTAWAFGYYTKTFQEAMEHDWDLSDVSWIGGYYGQPDSQLDHIFSPDFLYHQINGGGDNGSTFLAAANVIDQIGASTWDTMPYDPSDSTSWPDEAAWREAPLYRGVGGGSYVLDVTDSVEELKSLLSGGNLAQIAIDAYDMVEVATLDNFYNSSINHANTIVGYDDDFTYSEMGELRSGAFKVANSWGPTWSGEEDNDGCWWISYEAMKQRIGEVSFFEDRVDYNPELLAVFGITHSVRGDTTVTVGLGSEDAPLAAKDFISPGMSCDGDDAFPSNLMALDITEFADGFTVPANLFLEVYDGGSSHTGAITDFSVEHYTDYMAGDMDLMGVSFDPPVPTVQNASVSASLILGAVEGVDLAPVGLRPGSDTLYGLGSVPLVYAVQNFGDQEVDQGFEVQFYFSDNEVLGDGDDHLAASDTVAAGLGPFSRYSGSITLEDVPLTDPFGGDGDYYLLMSVDPNNDVDEVYEDNNDYGTAVAWEPAILFFDDFSTDKGWTGYETGWWERGPAQAGGGGFGNPDPGFDATPTADEYLLGYNIGGNYENSMRTTEWITSPVIDCGGVSDVSLQFSRWLNVEDSWYDHAYVQVYDGSQWQTIFENDWEITDSAWTLQSYDVFAYADGNPDFQVRFGMGPTDSSWRYSGWNIDDFRVTGSLNRGVFFEDDFSADKGWTGLQADEWERGPARAGGGEFGYPDPGFDATPTADEYLLGYNIGGDYENSIPETLWVASPVIDCSELTDVSLRFQRWLNVESPWFDNAYVEAYDGSEWHTLFENAAEITDSEWTPQSFDVSEYADGNSDFQIRFGMGPTDASWHYSGWNIDDLQLTAFQPDVTEPTVVGLNVREVMSTPVTSIEVYFSEDMALYPLSDGQNYSLIEQDAGEILIGAVHAGPDYVVLDIQDGPLTDGEYTLTLHTYAGGQPGGIRDSHGNPLDGDPETPGAQDFELDFLFKLPGLYAGEISGASAFGGRVAFYDTDAETPQDIDVRPAAVVRGNATDGITQVTLSPQYSEFGVLIQQKAGSEHAIAIYDHSFHPQPITYVVADCDVSVMSLGSNLTGMDLNGVTFQEGPALPLDIDGDGDTEDATGLLVLGDVDVLRSSAQVRGEVVVGGYLDRMLLSGRYSSLAADVVVEGDIGLLRSVNPIMGSVRTDGQVGSVLALGGTSVGSAIGVGGGLDYFYSGGDLAGDLSVGGDMGRLVVRKGSLLGDVDVGGALSRGLIVGDLSGSVDAGQGLNYLTVRGDLTGAVNVVHGDLRSVRVTGNALGALVDVAEGDLNLLRILGDMVGCSISVSGRLERVAVRGSYVGSDVEALRLGTVNVGGQMGGTGQAIHALGDEFWVTVGGLRRLISAAEPYDFDGVQAYVG